MGVVHGSVVGVWSGHGTQFLEPHSREIYELIGSVFKQCRWVYNVCTSVSSFLCRPLVAAHCGPFLSPRFRTHSNPNHAICIRRHTCRWGPGRVGDGAAAGALVGSASRGLGWVWSYPIDWALLASEK